MDKTEAHTAGPWAVREYDSEHLALISANEGAGITRNGGIYVARVQGPDNRANARLIAAAPELLAAASEGLQALVGVDRLLHKHGMMTGADCPAIAPLRAAIAKATGQ